MDNWSLGIRQGPDYDPDNMFAFEPRPLQLDQSRSVLSQVHTVLLIDDNASMAQTGSAQYGPGTSRWQQASAIICELAPIITQHDRQGIDLYFLKHRFPGRGNVQQGLQSSLEVQAVLSRVRPAGHALLEARVRAILDAYMSTLGYERYLKPLNLVVITDGTALEGGLPPFLSDTIKRHVDRVVKRGHPAHQLGIEFLQVGNSQEATRHLLQLEQQVSDHHRNINRDVVGITPVGSLGHPMTGELLAQLIGSGIDARVSSAATPQHLGCCSVHCLCLF